MADSFLLAGRGYLNQTSYESYLMPGWGFINENSVLSAASLLESSDVISASVTQSNVTANGGLVESSDIITATVSTAFSFGVLLESGDTISANAGATYVTTGALQESGDSINTFVNVASIVRCYLMAGMGYLNDVSHDDFLMPGWGYINGSIPVLVDGNAVLLESGDTIAANVTIANLRGALIESSDIITASAATETGVSGALLEGSDVISGFVSRATTASGALLESSDIIAGIAGQLIAMAGALVEGSDHITGFITNALPTPESRTMKVYPQETTFIFDGVDNSGYKTPAEVDLYSINYDQEITPDVLISTGWQSWNGDLTLGAQSVDFDNSYALVGGGTPDTTSQLINLVDTLGLRQIEYTINITMRQYNFATNKVEEGGASNILDYAFDWTTRITNPAENIITSTWRYDGNDTELDIAYYPSFIFGDSKETGMWLHGGTLGETYVITNTVTTNLGRTLESSFIYMVNQPIVTITPANDYTVEDGSEPYGTEDGSQNYGY